MKVFPLTLDRRISKIAEIVKTDPIHPHSMKAFEELKPVMNNNVVHAIVLEDEIEGHVFHLRSKGNSLTKEQVFASGELTNYAAYLCRAMRYGWGSKMEMRR